ncbi:major tail protein [Desulfitobacterium sp. PCE1]|uniref:major tail protein n=1 Tax=Desulfitobacterium sp. PCE1 TaxID=146907 RepID=UPI000363CE13|nr:major tail protein [Desulfitobacterium sp. PCE1]
MAIVGLEKLYYAKLTEDKIAGATYETPIYLEGVKEISIAPKVSTVKAYAENRAWAQVTSFDDVEVSIDLIDLTNAQRADLLGSDLAVEGGVISKVNDTAPYIALLYVANTSDGGKQYGVLYKGKMELPEDSAKGQEGTVNFQSFSMKASFMPLRYNGMWKYQVSDKDPDCPVDIETKFFEEVIIPTEKVETTEG